MAKLPFKRLSRSKSNRLLFHPKKSVTMSTNAGIVAVIISLFVIAHARIDPSAAAVSVRDDPKKSAAAEEKAALVSADLRPIRASLPLTTIGGGDRDISRQIAHSLRLPNLSRHVTRPIRHPPVELSYGHDMIESSKMNKIEEERDDEDSDSDHEKIKEEKMMKKKLKTMGREKENDGFMNWISGFLN